MNVLIDTHVLLWALADDARLSPAHRDVLAAADNALYLSAASVWEIEIKRALGKLTAPPGLVGVARAAGCLPLAITWAHGARAGALPPHHADPFDRLLIAQAQCEDMPLASADGRFRAYEVALI